MGTKVSKVQYKCILCQKCKLYNVRARRNQINIRFCKIAIAGGQKSPTNFEGDKSQLSDSMIEFGADCFK
jgi:hypothetical protein